MQSRRPDRLFVINNASNDGTREYLDSLNEDWIIPVHLDSNLGGAGGFSMALEVTRALGYDACWLFDDDGLPDANSLAALERAMLRHDLFIANALVSSETDPTKLAFGLIPETPAYRGPSLWTVADAKAAGRDCVIENMANPFNGTLVRLADLERAGNVRPEMFLWGDEVDFMRRAIRKGLRVATVLDARHEHPEPRSSMTTSAVGEFRTPPKGREIYFYRNRAYNIRRHHGLLPSLKQMTLAVAHHSARRDPAHAGKALLCWMDGIFDTYRLAPSRDRLVGAWRVERESALKQARVRAAAAERLLAAASN